MPLCRRSYQAAYAARVDEDIDPYRFAPVGAGEYVEHITFSNFYNIYIIRLSKNLVENLCDRAAGGVCGGQKAHRAFNQQDFETFLNVSKSAQRGENTFSTRCATG